MRGGGNRVYRDPRVDTPWRCRGRLGLARGVLPAGLARSRAHKTTQLVDATYPNLPYTYTYTYTYTYHVGWPVGFLLYAPSCLLWWCLASS